MSTKKIFQILSLVTITGVLFSCGPTSNKITRIEARDAKQNSYKIGEIYSETNSLIVTGFTNNSSDGGKILDKDSYTYYFTDPIGSIFDGKSAFTVVGDYTLYVCYPEVEKATLNIKVSKDTPSKTLVSLIASDTNINNYTVESIYDRDNQLTVTGVYNDGTTTTLNKDEYELKIYKVGGSEIDTSKAFGTAGSYIITVAVGDVKASNINFEVKNVNVPVTGISLNSEELTMDKDDYFTLVPTIRPSNATNKNVSWSSNNSSIVTVDEGLIHSLKTGTATITATTQDGGFTASCVVTVIDEFVHVTGVSLDRSTLTLIAGNSFVLTPTIRPSNATNKNGFWTSSDNSVATVDAGRVTAVSEGSATITITTEDGGHTATCVVTVNKNTVPVTGVTLSEYSKYLYVGDTFTLTATVTPDNASNKNVTWSSSASAVASVNNGVVTANSTGTATITVTTADGGYTKSCVVEVDERPVRVTGVSLNATSKSLYVGETFTLVPTVTPSNATNKNVTWKSSNSSIASVNNGVVTANAAGSATITVTTVDGEKTATCTFTITKQVVPVTGVSLDATSKSININSTFTLTQTVSPSNATNKSVTWSSNNTSVATVTNGVVKGISAGNAVITVETVDGNKTATCNVTVNAEALDAWTVLIYLCGNDLESENGLGTADINEILNVSGQPDDVNIVIETGGASVNNTYFSTSKLKRYHVSNKKMVSDGTVSYANMGLSSTLEDFIEWGAKTYPAEKTGLILWNHGGAMEGVCYDENKKDDNLLNSEVKEAVSSAFTSLKRTENFEFIGYDACLMAVQDIAEFNSAFFNYMVCSEESEAGYGWDYDTWVDDMYNHKPTETILKAIVDGFIADQEGGKSADTLLDNQTLSYLDLTKMSAYKTKFEALASALKNKTIDSEDFCKFMMDIKCFGDSFTDDIQDILDTYGDVETADYFGCYQFAYYQYTIYVDPGNTYWCTMDVYDFLNKLSSSQFNPGGSYISEAKTAFSNLVKYSSCQVGAGEAHGLAMYFCCFGYLEQYEIYNSDETNFSNWLSFVNKVGYSL